MRVAIDTNRLTDLFRGDVELAEFLGTCEEVWIPFVVLGEMKAGFLGGGRQFQNQLLLNKLLERATVDVLYSTSRTAEQYAQLFIQLRRAGTPIPQNDIWIAALALENDLGLITRDRHFDNIPQLRRLWGKASG